ncbi:hypothetical protein YC2023_092205 [Brassica napus]
MNTSSGYVNLLNSQSSVDLESPEPAWFGSQDTEDEVAEPEIRPVGVKAAKAAGKRKKSGKEEEMSQLQSILQMKEKLSKQKILERLFGKKDPLSEVEESLKLKLMNELL